MNKNKKFTWLHLSDLHVGMSNQSWLWPSFKHEFYEDIKKMAAKTGAFDVVIFSGDLTQQASKNEFENLSKVLEELWVEFRNIGFEPKLFTVPGNHDLLRPDQYNSEKLAISQYGQDPAIRDTIWEDKNPRHMECLNNAFKNYDEWLKQILSVIPCVETNKGKLIGDSSSRLTFNDLSIGIIGLNSTWLQLSNGKYIKKLCIDPAQIHSVTNNDPTKWCNQNDFNLLVTHHPANWLDPTNHELFKSEINNGNRFTAHLYGHMHEPDSTTISEGGGAVKRSVQAASIFGLETHSDNKTRIHGYSIGQFIKNDDEQLFKLWPRRSYKKSDGNIKLNPDSYFELSDENCITEKIQIANKISKQESTELLESKLTIDIVNADSNVLRKIKHYLPSAREHAEVRQIDQNICITALKKVKAIWIVSEWGMASDSFLWTVMSKLNEEKSAAFKIDLSEFDNRENFFDNFNDQFGCSFEQLCRLLSTEDTEYLILDDIPIGENLAIGKKLEMDIEDMANTILQYCPNLRIIFKSRRLPITAEFPKVELRSFDEADTKTYIQSHNLGGKALSDIETVSKIYENTDGVPTRIDIALKQLQVVSISELSKTNTDLVVTSSGLTNVPSALVRAISDMERSKDPNLISSYQLLKALSIFPHGELFDRIKRFNGSRGFYAANATELLDRALIEAVTQASIGSINYGEKAKTLIVKRPVREYINSLLSKVEFSKLNQKTLSLYFGEHWQTKTIKPHSLFRFDHPHRTPAEISNASIAILRLMNEATIPESTTKINIAIPLALHFSTALSNGDHYRGCINFLTSFIALIPHDKYIDANNTLKSILAKCLRMVKEVEKAKAILLDIKDWASKNHLHQTVFLNLALCCQNLNEKEDAIHYAREVKKINLRNNAGLQADSIILELQTNEYPERKTKLLKLENQARKKNANVIANNLALDRASETEDVTKKREILLDVIKHASNGKDFYTLTRAIVRLGLESKKNNISLTINEQQHLINSYHYLYNQRLTSSFNRCHEALWHVFETNKDSTNLLKLFRHSSLIWRLRSLNKKELEYAEKLRNFLSNIILEDDQSLKTETAYFYFRVKFATN